MHNRQHPLQHNGPVREQKAGSVATRNEIEKPGQLLAQVFKVKTACCVDKDADDDDTKATTCP